MSSVQLTGRLLMVLVPQVAEAVREGNYDFDTLLLSVSLPAQLCVREVCVKASL